MSGAVENGAPSTMSAVELMRRYMDSVPESFSWREEVRSSRFWKAIRAELFCSILLVILVGGSRLNPPHRTNPSCDSNDSSSPSSSSSSSASSSPSKVQHHLLDGGQQARLAFAWLASTASLVQCFGNMSGAQMNPAVTIGMLVTHYISPLRAACYIITQLAGSLVGTLVIYGLTPDSWTSEVLTLTVTEGVSLTQAFGVEFLAVFLVVLTYLAALDPVREDVGSKSLSIGLAYGVAAVFSTALTGGGLNPAAVFGAAVVHNSWSNHWVYWVGPVLGGILASVTYEFVHDSSDQGRQLKRSFRRRTEGAASPRQTCSRSCQMQRQISGISNNMTSLTSHQPHPTEELSCPSRH